MNFRYVIRELGLVMLVLCFCMVAVMGWAAWSHWTGRNDNERMAVLALVMSAAVGAVMGLFCWLFGNRSGLDYLGRREALLLVALTWLIGAAVAGLPYYTWAWMESTVLDDHAFASFASCYFESMSGLTTTGATVLSDVDSVPRSLLLWRATTHWLGGLGIVVLFVAVLPTLGVGGKKLFQIEATGPQQAGVRPRIRETARILWLIYLLLTISQIVLLRLAGMTWFDAVCHTFATLATGGFSTHNASIGAFDSWSVDVITIVFMVLAGANFGLYYQLARRRFRVVWRDPELRTYLAILFVATLVVACCIYGKDSTLMDGAVREVGVAEAARQSAFQVVSIQTTTGFSTADFDLWGFIPQAVLITVMFVGGCAGSTGGGIKVIRVLIAFKVMYAELERVFRPSVVRTMRVGTGVVDQELKLDVLVYVIAVLLLFLLGAVALMLIEPAGTLDFTSAATASAATLNNIGPGLAKVGATQNYGFFSAPGKYVLSLLMVLGRLELYAVLVLISPKFWFAD
ncbi:MAG: potassium transporter TrkG [Phycisphaerales bacterium]